jgi:DNA-binding MarR family transcriptional regulator
MDFQKTLGMRLRGAYLTLHRCLNLELSGSGVTADQFVVLSLLAREDGLTQGDIASRCASDPSTVGALLRLLETKKLVSRERHAEDGRALSISLTPRGHRLQKRAWEMSRTFQKSLGDTLRSERESDVVLAALDRVREAMAAQMGASLPDSAGKAGAE